MGDGSLPEAFLTFQRVHEDDVSGVALGPQFDYCHLMIPWDFDPLRQCDANGDPIATSIGWTDPRSEADEPAWPERFPPAAIARLRREADEWAWASQYQQSPMPRGGGILKREWWQPCQICPAFSSTMPSTVDDSENVPQIVKADGSFCSLRCVECPCRSNARSL
jgi:hypothetical protein